jgi:N-acetyl-1-D-myo-inositol-2-amino-2-deoxy-alpha-D-glucopyranoside deacetylase
MITETTLPDGPLLVVHAHPDDETLATGGLLATWAASGQPVTLVTCTRGERGEVIGTALSHLEGDGAALAAHREGELAAALASLGVTDHAFLDSVPPAADALTSRARLEDSGMAWVGDGAPGATGQAGAATEVPPGALVRASVEECAERLATVVRDRRPAVVVTYEPGGGYGHPDHVRAHEITVRALSLAAQDATTGSATVPGHEPAHVWWVVVPPAVLTAARADLARRATEDPWFQALLESQPTAALPQGPLPAVAEPARDVVATVDVRPVLEQVRGALTAHATQVHWVDTVAPAPAEGSEPGEAALATAVPASVVGWYALSNDVIVPWLTHEHYADATATLAVPGAAPVTGPDRGVGVASEVQATPSSDR